MTEQELIQLDGIDENGENGNIKASAILEAISTYKNIESSLDRIEIDCKAFVSQVEKGYNPQSGDYSHMKGQAAAIGVFVENGNLDPDYSTGSAKYTTVGDALAEYNKLLEKIAKIEKNFAAFEPAVKAMDTTQVSSVSATSPYLTKNFETLVSNYNKASSVYKNGTICDGLDPSTYPGLSALIERYLAAGEYVEVRIAECKLFISIIDGAEASSYYVTTRDQLNVASNYLDDKKEFALEKYEGVEDAVGRYYALVDELAATVKAANDYIQAVAAINIEAGYKELKAAVDAATALREKGNVVGIDGVVEANNKYTAAEAKVVSLEGNSQTLISAVENLKSAETLMERRKQIFIAVNAKNNAEDTISGVTAAKAELDSQIAKYNADIAAANALASTAVTNACSVTSASSSGTTVAKSMEIAKALWK
jgi:hypothetical protein